jgi:hypothetical protein
MAKEKKETKVAAKKGRAPVKNGLHDKVEFVRAHCKGQTRGEAVAALQKKWPDMSINYARTLVYSYMKDDSNLFAAGRAKKAKSASKPAKKGSKIIVKKATKAAPAKAKKAANDASFGDDF